MSVFYCRWIGLRSSIVIPLYIIVSGGLLSALRLNSFRARALDGCSQRVSLAGAVRGNRLCVLQHYGSPCIWAGHETIKTSVYLHEFDAVRRLFPAANSGAQNMPPNEHDLTRNLKLIPINSSTSVYI